MIKAGDYIFATVNLGSNRWAAAYFWKVNKIQPDDINYHSHIKESKTTNIWLEDVHGSGRLDQWPLSFVEIHETVNKEAAEILYGRSKS